uniref:Epoxide hydrolase N-terminal domain-containing protein n=1 Tax=Strigamia maritima TaxID=126957 RepID=T1IMH0_STRMM
MLRGGHFAAFEEPNLLADDNFSNFVQYTDMFVVFQSASQIGKSFLALIKRYTLTQVTMSLVKIIFLLNLLLAVIIGILWKYGHKLQPESELPPLKDNWWAKEAKTNFLADDKVHPFKISVSEKVLDDLKSKLQNARYSEPLEDAYFQYGFNTNYLKEVVEYWKTKYNWRDHEKTFNQFDGYKTQIDGIDIHFLHVKPKNIPLLPLLLIHGWPGSVYEFHKILPILTTPRENSSFGPLEASQTFDKLMSRLGFNKYYVQGGDWGSIIATHTALYFPKRVNGLHINMAPIATKGQYIKMLLGSFWPSVLVEDKDYNKLYPVADKFIEALSETGYMHIQATKPDTVGVGLNDSPVGLAAYILEKFSTWVNPSYKTLADGGLTKKFTLDELLTNVMVYWVTGSITSSVRFYKECFLQYHLKIMSHHFINVPSAIAAFPQELFFCIPETLAHHQFTNLVQYTNMPQGGHFAAFEEPNLLADDVYSFVQKVEISKIKK